MLAKTISRAKTAWTVLAAASGIKGKIRAVDSIRHRRSTADRDSPADPVLVPMGALRGEALLIRPGTSDLLNAASYYRAGVHRPPPQLRSEHLDLICELGTNIGAALAVLGFEFPGARLLGVEADEGNMQIAKRNLARFGDRATAVHGAIWDEQGELVVERDVAAGEHGFKVRARRPTDPASMHGMPALTVDALLAEHAPDQEVDYMHVTIEGSEPRVFEAGGEWPERVRSLRVELHPYFDYTAPECIAQMEKLGYRAWVDPDLPGKWVFAIRD